MYTTLVLSGHVHGAALPPAAALDRAAEAVAAGVAEEGADRVAVEALQVVVLARVVVVVVVVVVAVVVVVVAVVSLLLQVVVLARVGAEVAARERGRGHVRPRAVQALHGAGLVQILTKYRIN